MNLQKWINEQTIGDEMLWKGSWGRQVEFVRDSVTGLFCADLDYEDKKDVVTVISTHRSKSIVLPVYKLCREDIGLTLILRNNFFNWKMSVISEKPLDVNFDGLCYTTPPIEPDYTGDHLANCYFEGFPPEYIFGYYSTSDKKKFSVEIWSDNALWTAVFLIMRSVGVVKAAEWHTRESHRVKLNAETARRKAREAKRTLDESSA